MSAVTCDTVSKAMVMLNSAADTPSLKYIIVWEELTPEVKAKAQETHIEVLTLAEFLVRLTSQCYKLP